MRERGLDESVSRYVSKQGSQHRGSMHRAPAVACDTPPHAPTYSRNHSYYTTHLDEHGDALPRANARLVGVVRREVGEGAHDSRLHLGVGGVRGRRTDERLVRWRSGK